MEHENEPRTIDAVQTTLDIVEFLRGRQEAGVTEIASELGRSKSTVHSHLATLRENECVVKEGDSYRLGLKYLQLGEEVKSRISDYDVIAEELDDLAERSGEVAQFATEEHGKAVYLYKAKGENAVQTASSPGTRAHMHCISLGKAMLAHMPEERARDIIDRHGLEAYTDRTITDREELWAELADVRERGYAYDREEKIRGIRCVAAPVLANGEILGAVSVSGPSTRLDGDFYHEELPDMVTRAANVIEINTQFS